MFRIKLALQMMSKVIEKKRSCLKLVELQSMMALAINSRCLGIWITLRVYISVKKLYEQELEPS